MPAQFAFLCWLWGWRFCFPCSLRVGSLESRKGLKKQVVKQTRDINRQFTEEMQMVKKHIKKSTTLNIREIKIKTMSFFSHMILAKNKRADEFSCPVLNLELINVVRAAGHLRCFLDSLVFCFCFLTPSPFCIWNDETCSHGSKRKEKDHNVWVEKSPVLWGSRSRLLTKSLSVLLHLTFRIQKKFFLPRCAFPSGIVRWTQC